MFGKKAGGLIALLFLLGCADPQYVNSENKHSQPVNQKPDSASSSCKVRFQKSLVCVSWKWEVLPTESQTGSFIFRTFNQDPMDQFPLLVESNSIPQVSLWMPSMGHGSSPITVSKIGVGTYRASKVFFIMAGDWDLQFQIKSGNSILDEAVDSITF